MLGRPSGAILGPVGHMPIGIGTVVMDVIRASASAVGNRLIDDLADWLMDQALVESDLETLMAGCGERLVAAGVPVERLYLGFRTLHPMIKGMGYRWVDKQGVEREHYTHDDDEAPFMASPLYYMVERHIPFLRRRLAGPDVLVDFPVLDELVQRGFTDYLGFTVPFDAEGNDGIVGSWSTKRVAGFSEQHITSLLRVQQRLAVAAKILIRAQTTTNILEAYLGKNAARRILAGHIQRRDLDPINAVIWYSDLRGSTSMAGRMAAEDFLDTLDAYFECTAGAVLAHGGEVLLLIGDAVLAIFPLSEGATVRDACQAAMDAAADARARLAATNAARADGGKETLAFGLGLHVGEVSYGNIGVPERLELTVVGQATNEVARLETLTKSLQRPVIVSGEFARHLALDWEPLGRHPLPGIAQAKEVFGAPL